MFELKGKYSRAKVFTDYLEPAAVNQIVNFLSEPHMAGSKIRIMPDAHKGAGATIGTTMTILDTVVPNLVGVDIGCGLSVAIIKKSAKDISFKKLDRVIREHIPSGRDIHSVEKINSRNIKVPFIDVKAPFNLERAILSLGTLGGGNHFIELNEYDDEHVALVVHSGSRGFGKDIATYYQKRAYKELSSNQRVRSQLIERLNKEGREKDIQSELKKLPSIKFSRDLAYLEGDSFDDYLNDMDIAVFYADQNREAMLMNIMKHMNWEPVDSFSSIHNFIDSRKRILRKGAVPAEEGHRLIIPINMRDGSIIARGKGNPDWNYSAPHGAGRVLSRSKAKELVDFKEYKESMKGIWTSSVDESTIDESPMAYKPMDEILKYIGETVEIERIMKPLYNFKAH